MDNTTLTILGMLAAFLTAFLAEPIKTSIENRNKLKQLRKALYKELITDYFSLIYYAPSETNQDFKTSDKEARDIYFRSISLYTKTECFKQILQNDVTLFYQLDEAYEISILHTYLTALLTLHDPKNKNMRITIDAIQFNVLRFAERFATAVNEGILDKGLLKKLLSKDDYQGIINRVNDLHERFIH